MNADYYRKQIQSAQKEIAKLQRDKGDEARRIADLSRRISNASQAANRSSSTSTVASRLRDIDRFERDKATAEKRMATIESRIAQQQEKLSAAQSGLARAAGHEARQRERQAARSAQRQDEQMRAVRGTLATHDSLHRLTLQRIDRLVSLPEKIVVVFLAANPVDHDQLRLDEEVRAVTEMIKKAKHRDAVDLRSCWAVRPMDVLQAINEFKPTVVHFCGHGSDADEIIFQDDAGRAKPVSKDAIVQVLKAASGEIRLVFFNTCFSRNQAEAVVEHVEVAIGMKASIGDAAARVFASQFYSAIGFGRSIEQAFEQAKALLMMEGINEQDTPELLVRGGLDAASLILVQPPSDSNRSHPPRTPH